MKLHYLVRTVGIIAIVFLLTLPTSTIAADTMDGMQMAMEQGTPGEVTIELQTKTIEVGKQTALTFLVRDNNGKPLSASDLEIVHEKIFHLIGVRSDTNEFFHVHPVATKDAGLFSVEHTFPKPGVYWLWAEVTRSGKTYAVKQQPVTVIGEGSQEDKQISFSKTSNSGEYITTLNLPDQIIPGKPTTLSMSVNTKEGLQSPLDIFLGTSMHLSIIKDDGSEFIHTHPDSGHMHSLIPTAQADSTGPTFTVTFPTPGTYKAFAQFRPKDAGLTPEQSITATFLISVPDSPAPVNSQNQGQTKKYYGMSGVVLIVIAFILAIVRHKRSKK